MVQKLVIQLLIARILATKKINIKDPQNAEHNTEKYVEKILGRIWDYINYFNSIPEFTETLFDGRKLENIVVANEWANFIYPESVRLDPTDLKTENLRVIIGGSGEPAEFSYNEWLNLQLTFRSWFKLDLTQTTTNMAVCRAPKAMMDVLPVASYNKGKGLNDVRSIDDPFIPIPLKKEVSVLFRNDYLNTTTEQVISDWIAKFTV